MMVILMVGPVGNNDVMVGASYSQEWFKQPPDTYSYALYEPCFFSTKLLLSFIHAPNTVKHE